MQIIPEFGYGGAETMVENLSVCLSEQGCLVTAVSLYNTQTEHTKRLSEKGIKVLFLGKKRGIDISVIYRMVKAIKDEKPDIIHTHLYSLKYAALAAAFCDVKVLVHTVHNVADKEMGKTDRSFNRFLYQHHRVIPVALTKEIQVSIIAEYELNRNSVPIVFNGIRMNRALAKDSYKTNEVFRIIHVGRFQEQKNHRCIIQAAKILKNKIQNFEILLFGEGPLLEDIKQFAKQMEVLDCISFMGTSSNIREELRDSDIFILPSSWEGMPMTIIEAMSVGLPIIATKVGGVPDMIEDKKNGLLIENTAEELANSICCLYEDKELREILGQAAVESSQLFSAENMAKQYFKLYQELSSDKEN